MDNFVDDFLEMTKELESPDSYFRWSAYAGIAAIMRDNYFWTDDNGNRAVYPNIYVILYAKSAATRKGVPLKKIEPMIREIGNTKFLGGRFSIQAGLKVLSEIWHNEAKQPIKGASCIMFSEEICALFAEDKAVIGLLTDLYDYFPRWDNNILANNGVQSLEKVCITLLAASNDILFKDLFNKSAIFGGLLGRTFIVAESKKRHSNSGMYSVPVDKNIRPKLMEHLKKLAAHKGRIIFEEEAKTIYDSWYKSIEGMAENDSTGVIARMATGVIKIAMILAAAEYTFDMVVESKHIEQAISEVTSLLKNYRQVAPMVTMATTTTNPSEAVLSQILNAQDMKISKKALMRRLTGVINDIAVLDKSLGWLMDSRYINIVQINGEVGYEPSDILLEKVNQGKKPA